MTHLAAECTALHTEIACKLRLVHLAQSLAPLGRDRLQVDAELRSDALLPHDANLVLVEDALVRDAPQHIERKAPEMRIRARAALIQLTKREAQNQRIVECLDEHAARREIRALHRLTEALACLEDAHVDLVGVLVEKGHLD